MAKKKEVKKVSKKTAKSKSITNSLKKSVSKQTKKMVAAVGKTVKKSPKKEEKPKKIEKIAKRAAKIAVKPAAKPVTKKIEKKTKVDVEEADVEIKVADAEENTGDTLIEMARAEMAAVKIGQTAEKVEKASKFKAIKVERGNSADEKAKWQELNKRHGKDKAATYKMTDLFEALKPIQHKVLGWGFVLTNENDRLEVLFENGIKMLISNYKPN